MKTGFWLTAIIASIVISTAFYGCQETTATVKPPAEAAETGGESQQITPTTDLNETEQAQIESAPEEPSPKIVVENPVHDFGEIDPGSSNKCEFRFSNQGQGVLKIERVQSTCGCTVPELQKKTYLPGESGTVYVTFHPGQRSGRVSKHLYILSNDKTNPKAQLTIKANVTKKISYEPTHFRLRLDKENAGLGDIKIQSLDGRPFAITRIQIRPACMKIDYDPAVEANEFDLTPQVDMNKIKDVKNGTISITLTHPAQRSVSIPFDILPPFRADPATLIALNASSDKPIRKTLWILSNYGEDFEIESVYPENDAIKIINQEYIEDKYEIVLDIVPPQNLGTKRHFSSKLVVNFVGGERLVINCVGSISQKSEK